MLAGIAFVLWGVAVTAHNRVAGVQPAAQAPQTQSGEPKLKGENEAAQADQKISVEVEVVNLLASVRDKKGKTIGDLSKDDFVLTEDGEPQAITSFAKESNLPLQTGLMVDTSMSQRRMLGEERDASYGFLDHLLRVDKDLAFVIHFDREVEFLQEFTASRPKLQAALQLLQTPEGGRGGAAVAAAAVVVGTEAARAVLAGGAAVAASAGEAARERCCTTAFIWRRTN